MLINNDIGSTENDNKLIERFIKPKTEKLSKFQKLSKLKKSKSEKLAWFKKLSKNKNLPKFFTKKLD